MSRLIKDKKENNTDYGNWSSQITTELIVSDSISIDEAKQLADAVYYIERRPQQAGRCVIVKIQDSESIDILATPFSARSRVHEYGGGCYCIHEETVFFVNDSDQDIYRVDDQQTSRITTADNKRFADLGYDKKLNRLLAICETHGDDTLHSSDINTSSTRNSIVSIDINTGKITDLEAANDFYASPRLNTNATQLCWQTWNHPNMPWDGNQLWLAEIGENGQLVNKRHIAGDSNTSVFQPQWSPNDVLHFISDDTGWWHLYRYTEQQNSEKIEQLSFGEKEFGLPQWVFSQSTYAFINGTDIVCCYQSAGGAKLARLSTSAQPELVELKTDWQLFDAITADKNRIAFIAASDQTFPQLVSATFDNERDTLSSTVLRTSCSLPVSTDYYSKAQAFTFSNRRQQTVFANYYPPNNPAYQVDKNLPDNNDATTKTATTMNTAPPLIVICHGGPTGQSNIALDAKKQFWTSRGFALLDVNYSGSTGYGRQYRTRLDNNWGQLDVEDCCDAALHAVAQGLADKDQLIIRGSSAGGYTVLAALTFEQVFSAGASYYGISELSSLASDTHKFESRYLDRLIGPYPEAKDLYQQRSPINHTEQLNCPVIFFQGIEDRVVPKQQAEKMFDALDKKGLPVAAQYYAGEQHGFRKAETIKQSLENELRFYQLVLGLKTKEDISFSGDIQIKNI